MKGERLEQAARAVLTISLSKMQKLNPSSSRQQEGGWKKSHTSTMNLFDFFRL